MEEAKEFYKTWIKEEGDQDTIVDCLNAFAEQQNKHLIDELRALHKSHNRLYEYATRDPHQK